MRIQMRQVDARRYVRRLGMKKLADEKAAKLHHQGSGGADEIRANDIEANETRAQRGEKLPKARGGGNRGKLVNISAILSTNAQA